MNVGIVASNDAWLKPIEDELNRRGHDVKRYVHTQNAEQNAFQLGQLKAVADRVFVDWAQPPLEAVLQHIDPQSVPVFCRVHRIEMYADDYIQHVPWQQLAGVFFIAEHVKERMIGKWQQQPKKVVVLPHVGIRPDLWELDETAREWEPPWTIVMAGNIVPKKRHYTVVQLIYDLGENYRLQVVGTGGMPGYGNAEYHLNIGDLVSTLNINDRVSGVPSMPQEQLAEVFKTAHFVMNASNEEGCASVVAEGMACGCVPLINCWRGAEAVYPEEWIWRSPKHLYEIVEQWENTTSEAKAGMARHMREFVLPRYDVREIARTICDEITGPIDAKTVGEWYSTEMFDHMVAQDGNERQRDSLAAVRKWLPRGTSSRARSFVEIGCGTGYVSRRLACRTHTTVFGIDLSEKLIGWAREHNPHEATFEVADGTAMLPAGPHDAISAIDVLEHIPSHLHEAMIVRIADQLKPGGYLIARFPHKGQSRQLIEEHIFPKVLRKFCTKARLTTVAFSPFGGTYFELVARKGVE